MEPEARDLWIAFHAGGDGSARARIVESNLPLVRHVASRVWRSMGRHLELDELVNAGCLGLLSAVDSFDPSRQLAFSTYAVPRIRGAILDDLRKGDHSTRSGRHRRRQIAAAEGVLAAAGNTAPGACDTARQLAIDVDTLWKWKARARQGAPLSLDRPVPRESGEGPTMTELIPGSTGADIEHRINLEEEKEYLRDMVSRLAERERLVLFLYYHEELKLRQIAEILGVTESRVSQIRTRALQTLRGLMGILRDTQ
jgi:RNA polymerase sigma factor for flagellar operon FliA